MVQDMVIYFFNKEGHISASVTSYYWKKGTQCLVGFLNVRGNIYLIWWWGWNADGHMAFWKRKDKNFVSWCEGYENSHSETLVNTLLQIVSGRDETGSKHPLLLCLLTNLQGWTVRGRIENNAKPVLWSLLTLLQGGERECVIRTREKQVLQA